MNKMNNSRYYTVLSLLSYIIHNTATSKFAAIMALVAALIFVVMSVIELKDDK